MSTDAKKLVEQIAAEADATAGEPMPVGAAWTRPNKSVPVAVRPSYLVYLAYLARSQTHRRRLMA